MRVVRAGGKIELRSVLWVKAVVLLILLQVVIFCALQFLSIVPFLLQTGLWMVAGLFVLFGLPSMSVWAGLPWSTRLIFRLADGEVYLVQRKGLRLVERVFKTRDVERFVWYKQNRWDDGYDDGLVMILASGEKIELGKYRQSAEEDLVLVEKQTGVPVVWDSRS